MKSSDPYLSIGLRCNPFIAESHPGVPDSLWVDRGFSTAPPAGAKCLVQMLGDKGAGKTSHLKHWCQQTPGPYCYYPPGWGRWKLPPVGAIAYWDEADRIPKPLLYWALIQAARVNATIAAGTHVDLSWAAKWAGLSVQTIVFPPLEVEALLTWVHYRIAAVQLPDATPLLSLTQEQASDIAAQSGASWRNAAVHLHIWAAQVAQAHLQSEISPFEGNFETIRKHLHQQ